MSTQILMPALSPTMEEGKLAKWHVKEGDAVKAGDILAEIETDKATMEFEAIDAGRIGKILIPEGAEGVKVNVPIAVLETEDDESKPQDIPGTMQAIREALVPALPPAQKDPSPREGGCDEGAGGGCIPRGPNATSEREWRFCSVYGSTHLCLAVGEKDRTARWDRYRFRTGLGSARTHRQGRCRGRRQGRRCQTRAAPSGTGAAETCRVDGCTRTHRPGAAARCAPLL